MQMVADCPHCGTRKSAFTVHNGFGCIDSQPGYALAQCHSCGHGVLVRHWSSGSKQNWFDLDHGMIIPEPPDTGAPRHTPDRAADFFRQAAESRNAGLLDAAGTMYRKALESALKQCSTDQNANQRLPLYDRIQALGNDHVLTPSLVEWAHSIRLMGNDAVHDDQPFTREDADQLHTFTDLVFRYLFTLPGMLSEARGESPAVPAGGKRTNLMTDVPALQDPALERVTALTPDRFRDLAAMPSEAEWFANIRTERTRRAYRRDVHEFCAFLGITGPGDMRAITRPHVIAWRHALEERGLAPASIRRKLSALASLFDHLCECNAVADNPVRGVKRPPVEAAGEGQTPALSDAEARALLDAPPADTLKGQRDRAVLAVLLYRGLRRSVRAFPACDRGDQRPAARSRHRPHPELARPCLCLHATVL